MGDSTTLKIETASHWSIGACKYQVWHTLRSEVHGVEGLSDLSTPSFYSVEEHPAFRRARTFVGHWVDLRNDKSAEVHVRVSPLGGIFVISDTSNRREPGAKLR